MKKIILLLLLVLVSVTASARKSYIIVYAGYEKGKAYPGGNSDYYHYMTGDVPDNIEGFFYDTDYHCWKSMPLSSTNSRIYSIGEILNLLSEYGYEIEFTESSRYILSKEVSSSQTISKGDVNTDGEVNIADVNEVISLILGIVREHPEILEQIKKQTNH